MLEGPLLALEGPLLALEGLRSPDADPFPPLQSFLTIPLPNPSGSNLPTLHLRTGAAFLTNTCVTFLIAVQHMSFDLDPVCKNEYLPPPRLQGESGGN